MNKVSVIIPVYNCQDFLEKCLESVLNQTYENIEVILINDGSTDNSLMICKKIEKIDNRVKVFSKKNGGPSSARNFGLKKSTGDYVMFVDSDDFIENNMIEMMLFNNDSKYDVIITNQITFPNNKCNKFNDCYSSDFFEFIVCNNVWGPFSKLIKRSIINNSFDESYFIAEDLLFFYELSNNVKNFKFIDDAMYHYVINNNSLMNNKKYYDKILKSFDVFEKIINESSNKNVINQIIYTYLDNIYKLRNKGMNINYKLKKKSLELTVKYLFSNFKLNNKKFKSLYKLFYIMLKF